MGRLRTKSDYEDARNARILENQARLASIGIHKAISDIRSITSTAKPVKTHVGKYHSVDYERTSFRSSNRLKQISAHSTPEQTPFRRSTRLRGISANLMISSAKENEESSLTLFSEGEEKRPSNAPLVSDYEDLRNARILENQARLVSLGVHKAISDLRSVTLTSKPVRKYCRVNYERTPLRRSNRLKRINAHSTPEQTPLGRSTRLRGISANLMISSAKENEESSLTLFSEGEEKRPSNAPLVSDYEDLRNARILENQARLVSLGVHKAISDLRSVTLTSKPVRKYCRVNYERTPLRRSNRLKRINAHSTPEQTPLGRSTRLRGISANLMISSAKENEESSLTLFSEGEEKRPSNAPLVSDYEDLRNARILENQARLVSLGVHKAISDLRSVTLTSKPVRKYCRVNYERTPLRRSNRLKRINAHSTPEQTPLGRSTRLRGISANLMISSAKEEESSLTWFSEGDEKRPANAPLVGLSGTKLPQLSPEVSARRCISKGRGSVYDPVFGICCHFCRQKKLCGEEDCKRCSNLDTDQPCMGKTDCSVCHSSNGVFCRACLKVRYGEEIEEVRGNTQWMCPHCIEDKGLNPYWICNSSICLKKRKMASTGIAIYKAREMGFKSVAHLLMDELQRAGKWR